MTEVITLEYIWIDGASPTKHLRSKTRVIACDDEAFSVESCPEWGFDGSSTYQAEGEDSDLILKPVTLVPNPLSLNEGYLVMCEVYSPDDKPHPSNTRAKLRDAIENATDCVDPWIGFEQEYTLFNGRKR